LIWWGFAPTDLCLRKVNRLSLIIFDLRFSIEIKFKFFLGVHHMTERDFEIKMSNGISDATFFAPDGATQHPGVLFLTDIRGIREAHRVAARRLADIGYAVLMPNVFYRTMRPPVFDFEMKWGDPKTMQRFGELVTPLTPEAIVDDGRIYIDTLQAQPETRPGAIGITGHCFTGAVGLRIAAAYPEVVRALASYHGGGLYKDTPDSPHLVLANKHGEKMGQLLFEHAENDNSMPAEAITKFDEALAASGAHYVSKTIPGALHGWTVSDHNTFNAPAAEKSFQDLLSLFSSAL